ncbi:phosphoribosylaminoimidazolesuccinocarboxamide synthase [Candidatus Woesearchaeota archaeon]|jgi:phosphoribosylaminoimidazole-succinocarboxamide synthase|nr:phosphoribosylaminoimidazolesuccinocarboxamide synthase [Candidatus Woesearchaeota archaeon]MBT6518858.1 phosphoribosylaminoimidazolesuccinocarboxamide synthase [Candidatus Woesearchaeota archaeon]MBT7367997.1 phosphoribosylaminoimidazolesuccinocarboxamide synthase [Candidatus Woesearchaeota archaeon]
MVETITKLSELTKIIRNDLNNNFLFREFDIPQYAFRSDIVPHSGKVADSNIFDLYRLMARTDRISTHDCVHHSLIPNKGLVTTALNNFFMDLCKDVVASQTIDSSIDPNFTYAVNCKVFPVEFVIRRHLTGSGWKDFKSKVDGAQEWSSELNCFTKGYGINITPDMFEDELIQTGGRLTSLLFTPTTKAESGHDLPIPYDVAAELVGGESILDNLVNICFGLFRKSEDFLAERGLLLVDTKFELGVDRYDFKNMDSSINNFSATDDSKKFYTIENKLVRVVDEMITADSSRIWKADDYEEYRGGRVDNIPSAFDKQFIRDYVEKIGRAGKPVKFPDELVIDAAVLYASAYELMTGKHFVELRALANTKENQSINDRIVDNLIKVSEKYDFKFRDY